MTDPIADIIKTAYNRGLHAEALAAPDLAKQIRQQCVDEIYQKVVSLDIDEVNTDYSAGYYECRSEVLLLIKALGEQECQEI